MTRESGFARPPLNPGRRRLLVGTGLVGAAIAVAPGRLIANKDDANLHGNRVPWTCDQLRDALEVLRNDTFSGLIAFAVPGDDPYSIQQGLSTPIPGGMGSRADLYLAGGIDRAVPLPDGFMTQLLDGIGSHLDTAPLAIADETGASLGENGEWLLADLDASLSQYLEEGMTNSVLLALLLNLVANQIIDQPGGGPFVAPFCNLTWEHKGQVMAALDGEGAWLKTALEWTMPDDAFREAAPGVLQAMVAFVMRTASFASYNQFAVFDEASLTVSERPPGWVLSGYLPDAPALADREDDFIGYGQGWRPAGSA